MARRTKKPAVPPELARQWLKRFEEDGESPPRIAKADGYDVRTVRKQLDLMRQERERREAKQAVLRQALEKHYADLCSFADRIRSELPAGDLPKKIPAALREDPLWTALREHLAHASLWRDIHKWETLAEEVASALDRLKSRIQKEAPATFSREFTSSPDTFGLMEGITEAIVFRMVTRGQGWKGLEGARYTEETTPRGIVVRLGPYHLAHVPADQAPSIKAAFHAIMDQAEGWEEAVDLSQKIAKSADTRKDLEEELTRIILRRVVPGRCRYCPF